MLEENEREAIAFANREMIRAQIAAPFEKLFAALFLELIATSSVDAARLAERMEGFFQTLSPAEKDSHGAVSYFRLQKLLELVRDEPDKLLQMLTPRDEPRSRDLPEWFRGLIPGKDDDNNQS